MLVAPPCSSKSKLKKVALLVSVLGASLLTGCSTTTLESKSNFAVAGKELSKDVSTFKAAAPKSKAKKTKGITVLSAKDKQPSKQLDFTTTASTNGASTVSDSSLFEESAACRYLRKSSEVEAAIIGSPTVSASSDEDGSGSVSIGINLLDLRKADLVRATGDARCRMQTASKEIEATLGVGSQTTQYAAANAKQAHIRKRLGELHTIQARANQLVSSGIITKQDANLVGVTINGLKAKMELAKSEAEKRHELPKLDINRLRNRHSDLVAATQDLQNIERNIRSNDALEVSVSTGYRYNDSFNEDLQSNDNNGTFARVNLGIRLGALTAKRQLLEDEAAQARHDALFEENTGAIWRSDFAERAIGRVIVDLEKSKAELVAALSKANDTIKRLQTAERASIIRTRLQTKIERISIGSELAAVEATIKQLEENRATIRSL